MTTTEILRETAAHYNLGNRAARGIDCLYVMLLEDDSTTNCAFGRCMTPEALKKYGKVNATVYGLLEKAHTDEPDDFLQEKYHGHCVDFWRDVQRFHDTRGYWSETGLSELGERKLESLIIKWA